MTVEINSNEFGKLIRFLEHYGISNLNDYQFEIDPGFRGLNLRIDLSVTYLPQNKTITITLDP